MDFLPFFILIAAAVLFSAIFNKFHLPWVIALIVSGMVVGPYGLEWLEVNATVQLMSQMGLVFLMFMAGLEVRLSTFKDFRLGLARFAAFSALIPATVGVTIGLLLGFELIAALLLGIIFMSSSIAVIIPTLDAGNLLSQKLGKTIVAATIVVDIASLIALSLVLQLVNPNSGLPLWSFLLLFTVIMVGYRYAVPRIRSLFPVRRDERDLFESEVRIVLVLLFGTVITFAALGLHPIIAGFFTGLILSDIINSEILTEKLRTIGYGIFIPIFFVTVGAETNIAAVFTSATAVVLSIIIVLGSVVSKVTSGFLALRLDGFSVHDSLVAGIATTPQLSTTLAVVFTAVELALVPESLIGAMVILTMVTTMGAPLILKYLFDHPDVTLPAVTNSTT